MVSTNFSRGTITILDGYTDEPACLGVPPYLAPLPRYIYGAIKNVDNNLIINYMTIDEYRIGCLENGNCPAVIKQKLKQLQKSVILIVIAGAIVPGKYLRASPISYREILEIGRSFDVMKFVGGAYIAYRCEESPIYSKHSYQKTRIKDCYDFICNEDLDASLFDYLTINEPTNRKRSEAELRTWSKAGAELVTQHPDFPKSIMLELEAGRGCVRYFTGGCSFCSEPYTGEPKFREPKDVEEEVKILGKLGIKHFRIGALSCIFSYFARGIGEVETPKPNPEKVKELLQGIRKSAPDLKVLHLDNANPAVMAANIKVTSEILKTILANCTSGNVLSFGLESADPIVIEKNNLNTDPQEVLEMVRLVNKYGSTRGGSGMPMLLPGLNFVYGLNGESKDTFKINLEFLKNIFEDGQLLRRINLRQLISVGNHNRKTNKIKKYHKIYIKHKNQIREQIDKPMLDRITPVGNVLKDVFSEKRKGNITFGRQLGTYPILVGVPYKLDLNRFYDIVITDHGFRSITGFVTPFYINTATEKALQALPGIGLKRARRLLMTRPFSNINDVYHAMDDSKIICDFEKHLSF